MEQVGWETLLVLPEDVLSIEQLKCIFPKRTRISFRNSLFSWYLPKASAKAKAKAVSAPSSSVPLAIPLAELEGPISSRTRLKRKTFIVM